MRRIYGAISLLVLVAGARADILDDAMKACEGHRIASPQKQEPLITIGRASARLSSGIGWEWGFENCSAIQERSENRDYNRDFERLRQKLSAMMDERNAAVRAKYGDQLDLIDRALKETK